MGFTTGNFPPVEPAEFVHEPYLERLKTLTRHWVDDGFGAEFMCNAIAGFNFGDGHLHDQHLIEAIQRRCRYAPGEFIVVWVESESVFNGRQNDWVMDAAIGIVERGSWAVQYAVDAPPWLADGPIPIKVDYRMPGYERVGYAAPAARTIDAAAQAVPA